jgi:hypothetical protein
MSSSPVSSTELTKVVASQLSLMSIVSVDLRVEQIKYLQSLLTTPLKVAISNGKDRDISPELRAHYQEQQRLIVELIVKLQDALDREPPNDD